MSPSHYERSRIKGPWSGRMRRLSTLLLAVWLAHQSKAGEPDPVPTSPETLILPFSPQLPPPLAPRNNDSFTPRPDADPEFLQILLGYKTWLSFGRSDISMSGTGGYPNIISELKWRHLV